MWNRRTPARDAKSAAGEPAKGGTAPPGPRADNARLRRFRAALTGRLALPAVVTAVLVVHVWVISAGRMWPPAEWPRYRSQYYEKLADAFRGGQLHLRLAPDPRLLALPDPYDPVANLDHRLHDAVLYNGKYYLYWGPVPALLLVPVVWLRGSTELPDAYLVFAFTAGLLGISALLLSHIRRRFFHDGSRYVVLLCTAAAGLVMPIPFILARAAVYEAAILGGQFFLLSGLYSAVTAVPSAATVRRARLAVAGACWALAVGCRPSLAIAVIALAMLLSWRVVVAQRRNVRAAVGSLAALGAPLLCGALALGAYNHARFGAWHESGQQYQLAGMPLRRVGPRLFTADNVPPSLYSYALRPWRRVLDFPSMRAQRKLVLPSWITAPPYYGTEEITGILWTTPLFALVAVPVLRLARDALRRVRRGRASRPAGDDPRAGLDWVILCLLSASLLGFVPILFLIGSTMRYFADLTPALVILVGIALWLIESRLVGPRERRRGDVLILATVCAGYCIAIAMMLAITGYSFHFQEHNPELYGRMSRWIGGGS